MILLFGGLCFSIMISYGCYRFEIKRLVGFHLFNISFYHMPSAELGTWDTKTNKTQFLLSGSSWSSAKRLTLNNRDETWNNFKQHLNEGQISILERLA